jgi:glycosyltransferase involved in cell wall biosynthesis
MRAPLVSVLIPCYNAAPWLGDTLRSVLAQTWPHVEIIVVDDGSRDQSVAIAESFRSPRIKVVSQANAGQSAAENTAIIAAQGAYFEYLDADDLLAPDKIERQVTLLEALGGDYVASGEWSRFYDRPEQAAFEPDALWRDLDPIEWLVIAWTEHLMMHGAAWLVPRRVAERAGPWDERLSLINDFDYFSRILLASSGVKFCRGARTYYRSGNTGSLSGSKSRRAWESALLALDLGTTSLLTRESSARTRAACATVLQRFSYEVFAQQPAIAAAAAARAVAFGGSDVQPQGGPLFAMLSKLVGWQTASHVRQRVYDLGYAKAAVGWRMGRALRKRS